MLDLARKLVRLAGPIVLTQLGIMGFGVVDTLMLGRVGVAELDAAALGNLWLWGTVTFGIGVIFGLDPIIAQAQGRGDHEGAGLALQHGCVVAALTSIPMIALAFLTEQVLTVFGQDPQLCAMAQDYVALQCWSTLPLLIFYTLRQYLQSRELVAPALWVTLLANVANVIGNQVLIFEFDLGLTGAALASGITRTLMAVGLILWVLKAGLHRGAWVPWSRAAFDPAGLARVLRFGVPVGLQYLLSLWAFQTSTLLAGKLSREELAAHSIVFNVVTVTFMIPLGISYAVSTIIGNFVGAERRHDAQRTAYLAFGLAAGLMLLSGLCLTFGRELLPLLYTAEPAVVALAAGVFPIAGAFQLVDGIQVVGSGIMRGTGDTLSAALFNGVAYYLIALPLAAYMVLRRGAGLEAIWWSLALGLAIVAIAMVVWVALRGPKHTEP